MNIQEEVNRGQQASKDLIQKSLPWSIGEVKDEIMKAKAAQMGEVRTWSGVKMRKTAQGWVPVKDGAKEKLRPISDVEKQQDENDGKSFDSATTLMDHAKSASEQALVNATKMSSDPEVRAAAHKELTRRKNEEAQETFKAPEGGEAKKEDEPEKKKPKKEEAKKESASGSDKGAKTISWLKDLLGKKDAYVSIHTNSKGDKIVSVNEQTSFNMSSKDMTDEDRKKALESAYERSKESKDSGAEESTKVILDEDDQFDVDFVSRLVEDGHLDAARKTFDTLDTFIRDQVPENIRVKLGVTKEKAELNEEKRKAELNDSFKEATKMWVEAGKARDNSKERLDGIKAARKKTTDAIKKYLDPFETEDDKYDALKKVDGLTKNPLVMSVLAGYIEAVRSMISHSASLGHYKRK